MNTGHSESRIKPNGSYFLHAQSAALQLRANATRERWREWFLRDDSNSATYLHINDDRGRTEHKWPTAAVATLAIAERLRRFWFDRTAPPNFSRKITL
jgi:hypothetical protein